MKAGLFLTGACNLACNYCYASRCPPKPMSLETLHQSLAFLRERARGGLGLTLIGGEPLLCGSGSCWAARYSTPGDRDAAACGLQTSHRGWRVWKV